MIIKIDTYEDLADDLFLITAHLKTTADMIDKSINQCENAVAYEEVKTLIDYIHTLAERYEEVIAYLLDTTSDLERQKEL